MHPTLRCTASSHVHKPLIRFLGKRHHPSSECLVSRLLTVCVLFPVPSVPCVNPCCSIAAPDVPHPHPAAPLEFKQRFSEFVAKREASAHSPPPPPPSPSAAPADSKKGSNKDTVTYQDFWEAPNRLWQRTYSEREMNAIMVSMGATFEMIILIVGQSGGASNY